MSESETDASRIGLAAQALRLVTRVGLKPVFSTRLPLLVQRSLISAASRCFPRPEGVRDVEHYLDGVLARRLIPEGAPDGRAILYLHGGAYVLGSPGTHFGIAARLALAAGCEVFVIDYRLAPEHPAPAALDDAVSAWKALTASHGAVALAGDSAGGGLALATAVALRDAALVAPRALALISPWVDLTLSGESMQTCADRDPLLSRDWLDWAAAHYANGRKRDDPVLSPLFSPLAGLPPVLIHTGSDEVLLSDTQRLETALRAAGVGVQSRIYAGLWHDFQLQAGLMPQADASLETLGGFLHDRLDAAA